MKHIGKVKVILTLACLAAILFSCITFNSIVWPSDPQADTEIEVKVQVQLVPETERNGYFILAMLVPKNWKVADNLQAVYSAKDVQSGGKMINITEERMVIANDYTEPTTTMPYNTAMLSQYGVLGNTGPVEWVVVRGTTMINTDGSGDHPTTVADVSLKFKTGVNNVKFFTAVATCLSDNGFNTSNDGEFLISDTQTIQVRGGKGNDDYTVLHFVSTTPQTFRYGDFVSIEFVSKIEDTLTPLYGEEKIYLNAVATLSDGSEKAVKNILMTKSGDVHYFKYVYPKQLFGLDEDASISDLHVWFTNADGTKVATDSQNAKGYQVSQASE